MGSVGKSSSSNGLINQPTSEAEKYSKLTDTGATKWFANEKDSNLTEWVDGLSEDERHAIYAYTGNAFGEMNNKLYGTPWDEISQGSKEQMANLYNALNKFELKRGIDVTRATSFKIFGSDGHMTVEQVKDFLNQSGGVLQNDAFMSFGANDHGMALSGSGLVIHMQVPPSKGAGAYVDTISSHKGEKEFIMNSNAVLKFDPNSVEKKGYNIHVTAQWLGQAKQQTIDPNNKSSYAKKKK